MKRKCQSKFVIRLLYCVMLLFSFYATVSATLLVQTSHSLGRDVFLTDAAPLEGVARRLAFPQSKDSNSHKSTPLGLSDVKSVLTEILQDVVAPPKYEKRDARKHHLVTHKSRICTTKERLEPEWGKWTDWSSCSVTCGKGREIRWRHCLRRCDGMETEMEEKSCQLPACEGKLFGLIKL